MRSFYETWPTDLSYPGETQAQEPVKLFSKRKGLRRLDIMLKWPTKEQFLLLQLLLASRAKPTWRKAQNKYPFADYKTPRYLASSLTNK